MKNTTIVFLDEIQLKVEEEIAKKASYVGFLPQNLIYASFPNKMPQALKKREQKVWIKTQLEKQYINYRIQDVLFFIEENTVHAYGLTSRYKVRLFPAPLFFLLHTVRNLPANALGVYIVQNTQSSVYVTVCSHKGIFFCRGVNIDGLTGLLADVIPKIKRSSGGANEVRYFVIKTPEFNLPITPDDSSVTFIDDWEELEKQLATAPETIFTSSIQNPLRALTKKFISIYPSLEKYLIPVLTFLLTAICIFYTFQVYRSTTAFLSILKEVDLLKSEEKKLKQIQNDYVSLKSVFDNKIRTECISFLNPTNGFIGYVKKLEADKNRCYVEACSYVFSEEDKKEVIRWIQDIGIGGEISETHQNNLYSEVCWKKEISTNPSPINVGNIDNSEPRRISSINKEGNNYARCFEEKCGGEKTVFFPHSISTGFTNMVSNSFRRVFSISLARAETITDPKHGSFPYSVGDKRDSNKAGNLSRSEGFTSSIGDRGKGKDSFHLGRPSNVYSSRPTTNDDGSPTVSGEVTSTSSELEPGESSIPSGKRDSSSVLSKSDLKKIPLGSKENVLIFMKRKLTYLEKQVQEKEKEARSLRKILEEYKKSPENYHVSENFRVAGVIGDGKNCYYVIESITGKPLFIYLKPGDRLFTSNGVYILTKNSWQGSYLLLEPLHLSQGYLIVPFAYSGEVVETTTATQTEKATETTTETIKSTKKQEGEDSADKKGKEDVSKVPPPPPPDKIRSINLTELGIKSQNHENAEKTGQ